MDWQWTSIRDKSQLSWDRTELERQQRCKFWSVRYTNLEIDQKYGKNEKSLKKSLIVEIIDAFIYIY